MQGPNITGPSFSEESTTLKLSRINRYEKKLAQIIENFRKIIDDLDFGKNKRARVNCIKHSTELFNLINEIKRNINEVVTFNDLSKKSIISIILDLNNSDFFDFRGNPVVTVIDEKPIQNIRELIQRYDIFKSSQNKELGNTESIILSSWNDTLPIQTPTANLSVNQKVDMIHQHEDRLNEIIDAFRIIIDRKNKKKLMTCRVSERQSFCKLSRLLDEVKDQMKESESFSEMVQESTIISVIDLDESFFSKNQNDRHITLNNMAKIEAAVKRYDNIISIQERNRQRDERYLSSSSILTLPHQISTAKVPTDKEQLREDPRMLLAPSHLQVPAMQGPAVPISNHNPLRSLASPNLPVNQQNGGPYLEQSLNIKMLSNTKRLLNEDGDEHGDGDRELKRRRIGGTEPNPPSANTSLELSQELTTSLQDCITPRTLANLEFNCLQNSSDNEDFNPFD